MEQINPRPHQYMFRRSLLENVKYPFVIVSTLKAEERKDVIDFLLQLNAPVYSEAISGIREEPSLQHLRISNVENLWKLAEKAEYTIDGILRIGGVPTLRAWRDLDDKQKDVAVWSISHLPFSGLSRGSLLPFELVYEPPPIIFNAETAKIWLKADRVHQEHLKMLVEEEPLAEPALLRQVSDLVAEQSLIYLGNSLPIRQWDLMASYEPRSLNVFASRGMNGIDGQVSTFLGMAKPLQENLGIFGDLTMLYDLAAAWILPQMPNINVKIVVINNGGGKIFSKMFPQPEFQNKHDHTFEHIAKQWGLEYHRGFRLKNISKNCLIELQPCPKATERFWSKI